MQEGQIVELERCKFSKDESVLVEIKDICRSRLGPIGQIRIFGTDQYSGQH